MGLMPSPPRVLFVNPPVKLPRVFAHYPTFSNIGMLYNAAVVEQAGLAGAVVDAYYLRDRLNCRALQTDVMHVGVELDDLAAATAEHGAEAVVIVSTMFSDLHRLGETYVREVATALRRSHPQAALLVADCHVCGMNYFPYDPVRLLEQVPELDAVVLGEGDAKLVEVLRRLTARAPLDGIPEVAFRADGQARLNPGTAAPTRPLDALPPPAFHLLDMERYFSCIADAVRTDLVHEYHAPGRFLPLLTSRGCVYSCSFCTQQVLRHPWRAHSVEYLAPMIRELVARYRADRVFFLDNNISVDPERFRQLVELLAAEGIAWDAVNGYRADGLTTETLALMRRAGNAKVTVSAESGDPEVLRSIVQKRLDLKAVIGVARTCRDLGLPSQVHYVIGLPGETKPQINNTLEFATMLHEELGALPLIQHAIPFRGTALYRECEARSWFDPHPDTIPLCELETRPVIRTPDFTPAEVLRFKRNARFLIDARETLAVVDLGAPCNSRCLHCERTAPAATPPSDEELLALMRERHGRGAVELLVKGGEPTLRPETLLCLAREARAVGYRHVTLATNGRMLGYLRLAQGLAEAGIDRVVTSVHAPGAAEHDRMAGVTGAWHQTLAGIRNASQQGITVEVTVRLTRAGLAVVGETVDLLAARGIRTVHLRYPAPRGNVLENRDDILPFPAAMPTIVSVLRDFPRLDLSIQGVPFCLLPPELRERAAPLPFFSFPELRRLKAKHVDRCRACTELVLCLGLWREEFEALYRQSEALARWSPEVA
ncbi:MAG: radical SAM protein [Deltaproteobacteria bacterium]|nr:radical SAM protein [Deltaproteobacteria bacterium]